MSFFSLQRHLDHISEMRRNGVALSEIVESLKSDGCPTSVSELGEFLHRHYLEARRKADVSGGQAAVALESDLRPEEMIAEIRKLEQAIADQKGSKMDANLVEAERVFKDYRAAIAQAELAIKHAKVEYNPEAMWVAASLAAVLLNTAAEIMGDFLPRSREMTSELKIHTGQRSI